MLFCLHVEFVFMLMSFNWLTDDLLKDNLPSKFGWSIFAAQTCLFCEKYENPRNLGIVRACADKSHLCSFPFPFPWSLSIIHALPFPEPRAPPREYEKTPRLGRVPVSLKSWHQNLWAPELNFQNKIFRKNNLIPRVLSYLSLWERGCRKKRIPAWLPAIHKPCFTGLHKGKKVREHQSWLCPEKGLVLGWEGILEQRLGIQGVGEPLRVPC